MGEPAGLGLADFDRVAVEAKEFLEEFGFGAHSAAGRLQSDRQGGMQGAQGNHCAAADREGGPAARLPRQLAAQ